MTHYTFLVYHRDYAVFLKQLRKMGLLHISTPMNEHFPGNETWLEMRSRGQRLTQVLSEMKAAVEKENFVEPKNDVELDDVLDDWETLSLRAHNLERYVADLDGDIKKMEPWGDFNQESIEGLRAAGWKIGYWETEPKHWNKQWQHNYYATIIYSDKRKLYFVTFSHVEDEVELHEATKVKISPSPASTMIMLQTRAKDDLKKLRNRMGDYALTHGALVEQALAENVANTRTMQVWLSTPALCDGGVKVLEGWVPSRDDSRMGEWLATQPAVVYFSRPSEKAELYPILFHHWWSPGLYMRTVHPIRRLIDREYRKYSRINERERYRPFSN